MTTLKELADKFEVVGVKVADKLVAMASYYVKAVEDFPDGKSYFAKRFPYMDTGTWKLLYKIGKGEKYAGVYFMTPGVRRKLYSMTYDIQLQLCTTPVVVLDHEGKKHRKYLEDCTKFELDLVIYRGKVLSLVEQRNRLEGLANNKTSEVDLSKRELHVTRLNNIWYIKDENDNTLGYVPGAIMRRSVRGTLVRSHRSK